MRLLVVLAFAATVLADRETLMKETIKQVDTAFESGDWTLVRSALWRAKAIRERYSARDSEPLAKAVAKGAAHKDSRIAVAALRTLAQLSVPGSTKLIQAMLAPPKEVELGRHKVYVAAIECAADLHEPDGLKPLEKLLSHPDRVFAVAGAEALARYWTMDDRPKIALVERLVREHERLDKSLKKAKREKHRAEEKHYQAVHDALLASMRKLTGKDKYKTPAQFRAWCKRERNKLKS